MRPTSKARTTKPFPQPRRPGARARASGADAAQPAEDTLSAASQAELDQLVDVLKAVKQGDFSVRVAYHKDGLLARVGELLNDIIGLNEHAAEELVRVGKIVGQEGRMTER